MSKSILTLLSSAALKGMAQSGRPASLGNLLEIFICYSPKLLLWKRGQEGTAVHLKEPLGDFVACQTLGIAMWDISRLLPYVSHSCLQWLSDQ